MVLMAVRASYWVAFSRRQTTNNIVDVPNNVVSTSKRRRVLTYYWEGKKSSLVLGDNRSIVEKYTNNGLGWLNPTVS